MSTPRLQKGIFQSKHDHSSFALVYANVPHVRKIWPWTEDFLVLCMSDQEGKRDKGDLPESLSEFYWSHGVMKLLSGWTTRRHWRYSILCIVCIVCIKSAYRVHSVCIFYNRNFGSRMKRQRFLRFDLCSDTSIDAASGLGLQTHSRVVSHWIGKFRWLSSWRYDADYI